MPVVPGTEEPLSERTPDAEVLEVAERIGYPLMLKAVAGGGGKGMRMVSSAADLPGALRAARSEALSAFGDGAVYLERRIMSPRHIEIQLLGDHHGTVLPFVERECSIQRRHQKVVEESPSLAVSTELRRRMTSAAAAVAKGVGYTNAGTIEFLVDGEGSFYFLEMNTRLQVEHPITEMVTGVDLVQWQIRIARGERLTLDPEALLTPKAHAIECRIYAEDPENGFMPSPGRIQGLRVPQGPGVRDDSGAYEGGEVPIFYDPMISKLITWGDTRDHALQRMRRALAEYQVRGIKTTIPFFKWILEDADFKAGRFDTVVHRSQAWRRARQPTAGHRSRSRRSRGHCRCGAHVHETSRQRGGGRAGAQPVAGCRTRGRAPMIFEVAVGNRVRTVSVVRKGGLLHVTLDGHPHVVDARRVSDTALSLLMQNGQGDLPRAVDRRCLRGAGPARQGLVKTGAILTFTSRGRRSPVQVRPSTRPARHGASVRLLRTSQPGGSTAASHVANARQNCPRARQNR